MPTLNIDVNARVEKAKRDLLSLDKEVLKISKSEGILERELKKVGDTGPKAFRKIRSAAVRQAKAVNSAALQFKQLRAQMTRLGADPRVIGRVTSEFIRFRKEMEKGIVGTTRFQRAQDRLKSVLGTTKRQLAKTATAVNKTNTAAVKGKKGITGLGHTLENLGSTAVLVAGPLSGIGSRLIAFGAIAKRGSLLVAGLFTGLAAIGVFIFKAIKAFDTLNLSLAKTKAILKATGKEAHITAGFVEEAAARIARTTLANLEDTRPIAANLLSFRGIDEGNLESILALAQDVSATGFTDFANAAKLLGRVLEDPIANLDALRRVFVQLTPLQKDQVTNLQNMGRGAEAAGIIIDVLRGKFGGVGKSQNIGLSGAMDRLGQSWTHLLEDFGEGPLYKFAVSAINKFALALDKLVKLRIKIRDLASDFFGIPKKPPEPLKITITKPKEEPPSRFEKALVNVNTRVKRSLMDLNAEEGKLRHGFSLMSPEILKLAEKHKVLDDIVKIVAGDFSELTDKGREIANMAIDTSDALQNLARKSEGIAIKRETRTELEKYNDEMRRLIFLHDNNYISTSNLIVKQKKLRAALESATPELKALTSASEKFGDSLVDLHISGENFAEGFKGIFKSLVDDIIKQFLRLTVLNPIMNTLFGESSGRPTLGSQGGGKSGLGGAGGLLGSLFGGSTGKAANDNIIQEPLTKVADDFGAEGRIQSKNYSTTLGKTNVKMEKVGAAATVDFGKVFSGIATGLASAAGGALGSFLGNKVADLLGFQHGGSFKVGGSGGRDSQLVAFKASPREKVTVETPGQQGKRGGGNVTYIDARGVDPGQMSRLIQVVKDLDESVEVRAVNAHC